MKKEHNADSTTTNYKCTFLKKGMHILQSTYTKLQAKKQGKKWHK